MPRWPICWYLYLFGWQFVGWHRSYSQVLAERIRSGTSRAACRQKPRRCRRSSRSNHRRMGMMMASLSALCMLEAGPSGSGHWKATEVPVSCNSVHDVSAGRAEINYSSGLCPIFAFPNSRTNNETTRGGCKVTRRQDTRLCSHGNYSVPTHQALNGLHLRVDARLLAHS